MTAEQYRSGKAERSSEPRVLDNLDSFVCPVFGLQGRCQSGWLSTVTDGQISEVAFNAWCCMDVISHIQLFQHPTPLHPLEISLRQALNHEWIKNKAPKAQAASGSKLGLNGQARLGEMGSVHGGYSHGWAMGILIGHGDPFWRCRRQEDLLGKRPT